MKLRTIPVFLVAAAALCGCKQGEGESCQTNNDCDPPLICCKTIPLPVESTWGVCRTEEDCENLPVDGTTDPDVEADPDSPSDPGVDPDAEELIPDPPAEDLVEEPDAGDSEDAPEE